MATIADLMVRIGVDTDDLESGMKSAADSIDRNFAKIATAGVAGGAAAEGFARKQQTANVQLEQLAASTGIGGDAMRQLAEDTSNVTFPLEDVLDLMETGRQRGLESADELQRYATFWDRVGDATGESATELGKSGAALAAVGIEAGNEEEAISALGFVHQETTNSVKDFTDFLGRTGPELRELGADVDDTAAILGVMERELGLTGREARSEFRQAVNESEGDLSSLLDTLGISEGSFDSMRQTVDESTGVIDRNAQAFGDSFTPLQKLSQQAEEMMFRYGGLADAAGMLAVPLLALGPISRLVSMGLRGIVMLAPMLSAGFAAVGRSFLLMSKILLTNPWVLIATAVIALVVVIVKNWDTIVAAIGAAWDWITTTAKKVWNWLKGFIGDAIDVITRFFLPFALVRIIADHWDTIKEGAQSAWNTLVDFIGGIPDKILSALGDLGSLLFDAGKNIIGGLIDGVK
ncbi:MAG: phage tail tape measure protein, partial [bacterium]